MPKVAQAENYRRALAVLLGQYLSIDSTDTGEIILFSRKLSPEEICIKADLFDKLSDEAKEVIHIVLHGPTEILEFFASPKEKKINKRRIINFFSAHWCSKLIAKQTIREVEYWTNNLK